MGPLFQLTEVGFFHSSELSVQKRPASIDSKRLHLGFEKSLTSCASLRSHEASISSGP